jgi:hypothetical protein
MVAEGQTSNTQVRPVQKVVIGLDRTPTRKNPDGFA